MYKNRQHSTEAECRLFFCPILFDRCRFRNSFKLLSYQHTAKNRCFYSSFFIIGQSFFKSAFLLLDDAAQAAQLPEQPIHLPFLRRLTIKTVAAATAAAKMQIITMSAVFIQKGLRRCKL
jgi:hypothetical protein